MLVARITTKITGEPTRLPEVLNSDRQVVTIEGIEFYWHGAPLPTISVHNVVDGNTLASLQAPCEYNFTVDTREYYVIVELS